MIDGVDTAVPTLMGCLVLCDRVTDFIPVPLEISPHIRLIDGDLALAGFEDELSSQWPASMVRSYQTITHLVTP